MTSRRCSQLGSQHACLHFKVGLLSDIAHFWQMLHYSRRFLTWWHVLHAMGGSCIQRMFLDTVSSPDRQLLQWDWRVLSCTEHCLLGLFCSESVSTAASFWADLYVNVYPWTALLRSNGFHNKVGDHLRISGQCTVINCQEQIRQHVVESLPVGSCIPSVGDSITEEQYSIMDLTSALHD